MSAAGPPDSIGDRPPDASGRPGAHRVQATIAWAAWLLALVSGTLGAVYVAIDQASGHPVVAQTPVSGIAGTVIAATYASVGLMLVLRRPGLAIGWLFVGIGVVAGISTYVWGYVGLAATLGSAPGPFPVVEVAWLDNALSYPVWAMLSILLILLFPTGRPLAPSWRRAVVATVIVSAALAVGLALEPGPTRLFGMIVNPIPASGSLEPLVGIVIQLSLVGLVLVGMIAIWGVSLRYGRANPTERRQLRWFGWGSALTLLGGAALVFTSLAAGAESRLVDLSWFVFAATSITLPIAALIAILRERLYDIDRLISRTFVFGLLTAILAGLYSALIRLFNAIFVDVTGQSNENALVLTTLILATTFTPIKRTLEKFAERRFGVPAEEAASAPAPVEAVVAGPPAAGTTIGSMTIDELDRRFEAIARRVTREVLAGSARPDGAAQDHEPDQDQHERPEQVAEAGEARPQP